MTRRVEYDNGVEAIARSGAWTVEGAGEESHSGAVRRGCRAGHERDRGTAGTDCGPVGLGYVSNYRRGALQEREVDAAERAAGKDHAARTGAERGARADARG